MSKKESYILEKYHDIISEELNVKDVKILDDSVVIKKIYKPLGNKLSTKYGKETGKIIQFGKQWNAKALPNGQLVIFDNEKNERLLDPEDYDIDYEWLDGDEMAADTGIVVQMDLHITPELAQEGIAREISRFLNQMRKDSWFAVEKKANCVYYTDSDVLATAINTWKDFLMTEALLQDIKADTKPQWSHTDTFSIDEWTIIFALTSH